MFLGDGLSDLFRCDTGEVPVYEVRGNCDVLSIFDLSPAPEERIIILGGVCIMMMHGHAWSAKSGIEKAAAHAAEKGADILLFGHTHRRYEEYFAAGETVGGTELKKPLRIFNPGAAGGSGEASFGVIEIRGGDMVFGWGEL
jgi:predicted phosphodiesterase